VGETNWQVTYETAAKESNAAEKLTIIHSRAAPTNIYTRAERTRASAHRLAMTWRRALLQARISG